MLWVGVLLLPFSFVPDILEGFILTTQLGMYHQHSLYVQTPFEEVFGRRWSLWSSARKILEGGNVLCIVQSDEDAVCEGSWGGWFHRGHSCPMSFPSCAGMEQKMFGRAMCLRHGMGGIGFCRPVSFENQLRHRKGGSCPVQIRNRWEVNPTFRWSSRSSPWLWPYGV